MLNQSRADILACAAGGAAPQLLPGAVTLAKGPYQLSQLPFGKQMDFYVVDDVAGT